MYKNLTRSTFAAAALGCLVANPVYALWADRIETCRVAFSPRGDALQILLQELKATQTSVDAALYYLSNVDLIDAMCHLASKQNVTVRIFVDQDMSNPAHSKTLDKLLHYGATVYVDNLPRDGKLHLKTVVIDKHTVVTGSANWTKTSFAYNGEDTLVVKSKPLAQHYLATYDWLQHHATLYKGDTLIESNEKIAFPSVGKMSRAKKRSRLVAPKAADFFDVQGLEVYFSPQNSGMERFVHTLHHAQQTIDITIYMVTHPKIVKALCDVALAKRCRVRIIADDKMISQNKLAIMQELWEAGVELWYLEDPGASLHTKNCTIDGRYVWSGSSNWTSEAAERNCEDMLLFSSRQMGRSYTDFFDDLIGHAKSFASIERGKLATPSDQRAFAAGLMKAGDFQFPSTLTPTSRRTDYDDLTRKNNIPSFSVQGSVEYLDDGEYLQVLLDLIQHANQSIIVSMYHVAKNERSEIVNVVLNELGKAAQRGLYVYIVLDIPENQSDTRGDHSAIAEILRTRGVDVRLSVPTVTLHEKMVVVDLCKILIGSHNWSEGALTGKGVYESSAFILLPQQDVRFAQHILKHNIVSDMRSKTQWEKEISLLRHIASLKGEEREAFVGQLSTGGGRKSGGKSRETEVGRRRAEVGGRESGIGSQRSEAGNR